MSVLAAVARSSRVTARAPAVKIAVRNLGETTVGPAQLDFGKNLQIAKDFFTKDPSAYYSPKRWRTGLAEITPNLPSFLDHLLRQIA